MKIAIVGIGGRIASMFAFELAKKVEILGIGTKESVEKIKSEKIWIKNQKEFSPLKLKSIEIEDFPKEFWPDFLFLGTKNPVTFPVVFYYQKLKEKNKGEEFPALILPQNGILATKEAKEALQKLNLENLPIVRMSVFNSLKKVIEGEKEIIEYSLPLNFAFCASKNFAKFEDLKKLFRECSFEAEEIKSEKMFDMELSKLFLNLIGMACAAFGLSIKEGFEKEEIFKIEILALKEFIKAVKKQKNGFLNFRHYPVKNWSFLFEFLPLSFFLPFRKKIGEMIFKKRGEREKGNLDEINYYNRAVIELAKRVKIETPYNELIYKKIVGASGLEPETF